MVVYFLFAMCLTFTFSLYFSHKEIPKHCNLNLALVSESLTVFVFAIFGGDDTVFKEIVSLLCLIFIIGITCLISVSDMNNTKRYLIPEHKVTVKSLEDSLKWDRHTCECTDRVFCIDGNTVKFENGIKAIVKDSSKYLVGELYSVTGILVLDSKEDEILHDCMEFYN